jgi:hypothetical protein
MRQSELAFDLPGSSSGAEKETKRAGTAASPCHIVVVVVRRV